VRVSRARNRSRAVAALGACFFLSGTASLMLEVVWTRLLRLVFGCAGKAAQGVALG
jgi:hypothetical protein